QYLLALNPNNHVMTVQALSPVKLPPHKSLELWMLPGENKTPISCGILPASGRGQMTLPKEMMGILLQSQGLAVSLEPEGGAPEGKPTGPVVYQGKLISI
ncbi:MAG: anti-sigma factor, partial [bacterium]|nr:anti-sigma factor [bacterium]